MLYRVSPARSQRFRKRPLPDRRIVERQVAFHDGRDDLGGRRRKPASSDLGRARGVLAKNALSAHDRAHRRGHARRLAGDQRLGRREGRERVLPGVAGPIASPDVDDDFPDAPAHGGLAAERVGPEAVDRAALQSLGGRDAEGRSRIGASGYRGDLDTVADRIDADLLEELEQGAVGPWGGADPEPLDGRDVAPAGRKIRSENQKPGRALREGDDELRALPARKRQQGRVGAAGHEIDRAVAQRVHRVERRQELDVGVEAFLAIEAELLGRQGGKVRVRHEVGRRDLQRLCSGLISRRRRSF